MSGSDVDPGCAHGNLGRVITGAVALTSMLAGGAAVSLEGIFRPGDFVDVNVRGTYLNNSGVPVTPSIGATIGGVTVPAYTPASTRPTSSQLQPIEFDLKIVMLTVGAAGTIDVSGSGVISGPVAATPQIIWVGTSGENPRKYHSILTVDNSGDLPIDILGISGAGSTNFTPVVTVRMGRTSSRIA